MHYRSPKDFSGFPSATTFINMLWLYADTAPLANSSDFCSAKWADEFQEIQISCAVVLHFTAIFITASVLPVILANTQYKYAAL